MASDVASMSCASCRLSLSSRRTNARSPQTSSLNISSIPVAEIFFVDIGILESFYSAWSISTWQNYVGWLHDESHEMSIIQGRQKIPKIQEQGKTTEKKQTKAESRVKRLIFKATPCIVTPQTYSNCLRMVSRPRVVGKVNPPDACGD